jgi:rRNA processing protein Krr1/Pno1
MVKQREKNLKVHEKVSNDQQAFRDNIVTDSGNDLAEKNYLEVLALKKSLGVVNEADLEALKIREDPREVLTRKILGRLNGMSVYSADFQQVCSIFGTTSRVEIAKRLAESYIKSASMKNVMRRIIGPDGDLNTVGEAELKKDLEKEKQAANNPMG